jgi:hypothetical protein
MKKFILLLLSLAILSVSVKAQMTSGLTPLGSRHPQGPNSPYIDCGTYPGIEQDIFDRHLRMQAGFKALLPTSQTRDIGNIFLLEDNGSIIYEDADGLHINDYAVGNAFYASHPDSFDFLLMFRNFDADMFGFAYHFQVKNSILGIGRPIFDNSFYMGSAGRMQGFTNQNDINYQPDDPHFHMYRVHSPMTGMLHETMHQWAAYLNNYNQVTNQSHWYSFSHTKSNGGESTTSAMEGYIWNDNGGGDYQGYAFHDGLYPLDLYVMGLYAPEQVPDIWYLQNPIVTSPLNVFVPPYYAIPVELHATGTPDSLSIWDIVAANDFRDPDTSASQKAFNMAIILVVKNGEVPTGEELARVERFRQEFESYFYTSTESLATMNLNLIGSNSLEIVTTELRRAIQFHPYSESIYVVGGTPPYSWSVAGTLPPVLTFSNGLISGTPGASGVYPPVTFIVQDAGSKSDTVSLSIIVSKAGQSPVVINELELWERYNVGAGIELYNKGDSAVDLQDWTMEVNGVSGRITYTFPAVVLPPKSFLVLLESKGNNTSSRLFIGQDIAWIYNGSGFCSLKDNLGNGVDFVRFGSSTEPPPAGTSWSGPNPTVFGEFHNLVRDSSGRDDNSSSDWLECNGNLGRKNLCATFCFAVPGDANSSGTLTLGDIIAAVNYIFNKPGCSPLPLCWLSFLLCRGDWNASTTVTLGDVIQGVNYIFNKPGGPWTPVASDVCCQPLP